MKKLWQLIPERYRRRSWMVAATIFLRALLNFIGVATLIPVLTLILDSRNVTKDGAMAEIYEALHFESYTSFVYAVCGATLAIILFKNVAIMLLYRYERNYIFMLYRELSRRLYRGYHYRGLEYIKQNNSALLTRNVNVVTLNFVIGILRPIATIISEALLLVLLFGALMLYSPRAGLLIVGIFLPVISLFYFALRRRLINIGERENEAQRTKSRIVAETFRGYADIEVNGAFERMMQRFDKAMNMVVAMRKRMATMNLLPQAFTEIGLVIGMIILIVISHTSQSNSSLLFGIFAVAAIRLVPSIRSILSAWSTIRYNRYTIDTLSDISPEEAAEHKPNDNRHISFERSIRLEDITFCFSDADTPTINNLSLEIAKGECLGIRGSSGVGKTTLFNIILGLYKPTSGAILIDDERLTEENLRQWQNSIGYVSQSVFIADMTIAENIALGSDPEDIDPERIARAIELADLTDFIKSLPHGIHSRIGEQGSRLSGGQRQRIGIARALYKGSSVLLFDEATSSLDNKTEQNINHAIQRLSHEHSELTIVVIAHRESSLEYCNRVITLN